jgi:cation:H+ antiporter
MIVIVGSRFTGIVDVLADRTGLGEAITGAVFMGATTSIPDLVVSTSTAAAGRPEIAVSNALGGIAIQTAFLAVADAVYRKANLEHAAASLMNMLKASLLMALLAIPIMAIAAPPISIWGVHPASLLMFVAYGAGLWWSSCQRESDSWIPEKTRETVADEVEDGRDNRSTKRLWLLFGAGACGVALAGFVVAETGMAIADRTGLSDSAVGAVMTGVVTSSGELVTSIAAVRRGALTLAVGGVIGGNTFDTLLVPVSDVAYRDGSIYHAVGDQPIFLIGSTVLMTAILLMGLLSRQKFGWGRIGFESILVLAIYVGTAAIVVVL